ncbi:MAG: SusC/RagA family TonB-linked outer membrane protein [Fermentimonas sp.]
MKRDQENRIWKRGAWLTFILLFSGLPLMFAQSTVTGTVKDANGQSLIGVNVVVKGTTTGVSTNVNGEFSVRVPNANAALEFSYVGYQTEEVNLQGRTVLNVIMREDAALLQEVVVVGYGTQKKEHVTGSVAQVNADDLIKVPTGNLSNALVGKLPGLVSMQKSGQPGNDHANLLIRGVSTLGNAAPMVIVDDVQRNFNNLDPNEIESITILKDASSAAVYGMQGAGGVILVKTKRGTMQKARITYSGKVSYNQNTNYPKFLNGPDFIKWYNKALDMDGLKPLFTEEVYNKVVNGDPEGKYANTDWFDELMKKGATSTHHNVSVNGGNENAKYFVSLGYFDQGGIIDKYSFKRYNLRSNLDIKLAHGLNLGLDIGARQERRNQGYYSVSNQAWNNPITLAQRMMPITPTEYEGLPVAANISTSAKFNPMAFNSLTGYNNSIMNVLNSSLILSWNPVFIQGLTLKLKASYDKDYTTSKSWAETFKLNSYDPVTEEYSIVIPEPQVKQVDVAVLRNSSGQASRLTLQPSISYDRTFDKHAVSGLLLYEQSSYDTENFTAAVQGFDLTSLHELTLGKEIAGKQKTSAIAGGSYLFNRAGFVGRVNYAYDSKYLLELVARYDGSVRFPKENRWGFFPAASFGWRMSEEAFFAPLKDQVENFKIRGSAGLLGNDRIGDFQYLNLMRPNPPTLYIGDREYISIYTAGNVNRDITWEKTGTYNIGFELMLNRGIFGMEFDYFYKLTNDILIPSGGIYPPSLGGNHPSTINGGKVSNKGFELILTHQNNISDFHYSVRGNVSWSRNKVLRMNESPNVPHYQKRTGRKMGEKMGFIAEGLYQSDEEVINSATLAHLNKNQIRPGDIRYKDLNLDGKVESSQDYTFIGNSNLPELFYGLNIAASWRNFDLSLFFQGAAITDVFLSGVYDNGYVDATIYTRPFHGNGNSPYFLIENSWTPQNPNAEFTRLTTIAAEMGNCNGWASDWWLRDGSYLRLKNAQIGYTLQNEKINAVGIDNIRFTLTGGNLLTWSELTKYNIDPETPEITNGYYPQQRTYEFGVSLTF